MSAATDSDVLLGGGGEVVKPSPGAVAPAPKDKLVVFGVLDLTEWSENTQAMFLAGGALLTSLGFAYLQEKVFLIEGFHFPGFMTLLTTLTFMVCALVERYGTGDVKRRAPMQDYVQLSVWTMSGMYFTNWSLTYLNYPTRILAKSSKVIPVMIVGMVVQGRYYTRLEYLSACILALGIALFTMGDAYDSPKFDYRGLGLISVGVFADAMTANFEEARLFRQHRCSQAEVMFYSSGFSAVWTFLTMTSVSNELQLALEHAREHTEVITWTVSFACMGYASVVFVLLLIKRFGATNAEIVKSCRKVFSIIISFAAFGKSVGRYHLVGGFLFSASVALGMHIKQKKMKAKHEARKNQKDGSLLAEEEEEYHGGGGA